MNKSSVFILLIFLLAAFTSAAQHQKVPVDPALKKSAVSTAEKSSVIVTPCSGTIRPETAGPQWNRRMINFEKRHVLPPALQAEKDRKTAEKEKNRNMLSPIEPDAPGLAPEIGVSIHGNAFDGYTPPDNSIAISNNGTIVSVINSNIEYYDYQGTLMYSVSFVDFFGNDPELTGSIYDPVVLYDSEADRFFMTILHGSESSTNRVILCFTKSSDISDGWWYYKLTGNPLLAGNWFDYPKVGVSNNEVYVTGNLFTDANVFSQSVIYQVTKAGGYAGGNLTWQYWHNISTSNPPFTIVPASHGHQGNYGPGLYFISTIEKGANDEIGVYDLTDDLTGSPQLNNYSVATSFSLAGDALQKGTVVKLNNDDTRGLHAFYLNGIIHFTFHSDRQGGYAGINYNRITVSNLSLWNSVFGNEGYDYSYPSLASFTNDPANKSVIIGFSRSGSNIYPECRAVFVDDAGTWSASTLVKDGETYVDVYASEQITRWGDYSGVCRKNSSANPEVWIGGCYGNYSLNEHSLDTWIAQVKGLLIGTEEKTPKVVQKIYPNPVEDRFTLDFDLNESDMITISLSDLNGRLVKVLFSDKVRSGRNQFSFNKGMLSSGTYFLMMKNNEKILSNEKIIIL